MKRSQFVLEGIVLGALLSLGACTASIDEQSVVDGAQGGATSTGGTGKGGAAGSGVPGGTGGTSSAGGAPGTGGTSPSGGLGGSSAGQGNLAGGGSGGSPGAGGGFGSGGSAPGGNGGAGGPGGSGGSAATTGPFELEFVGNITTNNNVDTDGEVFSRHWDQITPENAGKWGSVQSTAGAQFNWRTLDAIYDYAQRNNVIFKQHTFVWGRQQPSGNISESQVRTWMTEFCRRYPNTKLIDVVNEPPPHTTPSYANAIGGGTDGSWQWIINSFRWAREACPNAILILNDYSTIEWGSETTHIVGIVKTLQAAGAPIDAIGAQAHSLDAPEVAFDTVEELLARMYNETGLPVYITEMDISSTNDTTQLELYQQYFPLFRDSGFVKGITIWGWIYGKTWSESQYSGLVRNGSARPAMSWLMQELGRPVP